MGVSGKHKIADEWWNETFIMEDKLPRISVYQIKGPESSVKVWHQNHLLLLHTRAPACDTVVPGPKENNSTKGCL